MSGFLVNSDGLGGMLSPVGRRNCDGSWHTDEDLFLPPPLIDILLPVEATWEGSAGGYAGYQSQWWPNRGGFLGDLAVDIGLMTAAPAAAWPSGPPSGTNGRLSLSGVTRDQYGSAIGGCTVLLFRTSDKSLQSEVVSDANGAYLITTAYYPDAHFIVVYKAGSPDIFGTTVNTLVAG